jgi:hypothetical protein
MPSGIWIDFFLPWCGMIVPTCNLKQGEVTCASITIEMGTARRAKVPTAVPLNGAA